ncbi:MAG: hypothetical protein H6736_13015 [Alphaproteobacteria bacterium]|nr:hypothetical protein [Myxococcales bacterium]MCB9671966.1 hypothetical protein [Alphaproteobacteria bacterium]MCB9692724.1 hypothetical protein [Alphaproteobacteria bacterium]
MIVLALLSLTGCDAFQKAKGTLEGVLEPVVVEGIVLGIEAPQGAGADTIFSGSDYQAGTSVTVFLADAKEVDEIENAPIEGADVTMTDQGAPVDIPELGDGGYALAPGQQLPYAAESTWTLSVSRTSGDETSVSTATLLLPPDHDFADQIPAQHDLNVAIDIDFTGLGYDTALIVVLDEDGVAYSNEPSTIRELYDFTHGNGDLGVVTVPADIFDAQSLYLVGVAGMTNTRAADLDEANTALSTVMMGKMRFYAVSTVVLP